MTDAIRPRRSALYMPAANLRALEKAKSLPADSVIVDLEDSVAPDGKAEARAQACAAAAAGGYGPREVVVRINGLGTEWGKDDLAAVAISGADAVCVPKVETAKGVAAVRAGLESGGASGAVVIWAMIETPLGVLNVREIAESGPAEKYPISVLLMGANDLAKETRAAQTAGRQPMLAWLSQCVVAARAYGIDVLDSVYNNFRDEEGFRRECAQGRDLGMDGKSLIHPSQIGPCNEIFSPGAEEVAQARRIIAAFEEPENEGKGVITVDGQMAELLHLEIARRTVTIADAISGPGKE